MEGRESRRDGEGTERRGGKYRKEGEEMRNGKGMGISRIAVLLTYLRNVWINFGC